MPMSKAACLRILITAGPTREHIDPVRYLSNESSGKMGFALAQAAARRGHDVRLVHGPVSLVAPAGVATTSVLSAAQMLQACQRLWPRCDALIMAAAVADYAPVTTHRYKLKKHSTHLMLKLSPTVDILATLASRRRPGQVVMGFALENRRARHYAADKLRRKRLDAIALNRPDALGAAESEIELLISGAGWQCLPRSPKRVQATRLVKAIEALWEQRR